uniref:myb/SANT-like DNA-binding domain-containing protein 4 n=1 Tax=Myxine glutinosa TaxID=7769 RepID=UPI00358F6BEC
MAAKRSTNWLREETEALVEAFMKRKSVLKGKITPSNTPEEKARAWKDLTESVNAVGHAGRTVSEVKKRWDNVSTPARRKIVQWMKQSCQTGGGPPPPPLSPNTLKIWDILGHDSPTIVGIIGGCETTDDVYRADESLPEKSGISVKPESIDSKEHVDWLTTTIESLPDISVTDNPADRQTLEVNVYSSEASRDRTPSVQKKPIQDLQREVLLMQKEQLFLQNELFVLQKKNLEDEMKKRQLEMDTLTLQKDILTMKKQRLESDWVRVRIHF